MLSIEYLDGRSAEWGWSWGDAGADLLGASLFSLQQLTWKEQKIQLKFSSFPKRYDASLKPRVNDLFGSSFQSKLLKDYNAQTYWLSFNLHSVFKSSRLPAWLNISFGYGAEGMLGGYENYAVDKNGSVIFDKRDIPRYRQWFLSPDIDLSKIKTKSRFLHTVLETFNALKVPAPTLEFSRGSFKLHALTY